MPKGNEEKLKRIQGAVAELKARALAAARLEPFTIWVQDDKGGVLVLETTRASDTTAVHNLDWESKRLTVCLRSDPDGRELRAPVDF
jgi:hypothetical protein